MEKENKNMRFALDNLKKSIKKTYSRPFRNFLISLRNWIVVGTVILLVYGLFVLIISKPMILAMLLAFAIAFYIIKKLSDTPMSKLAK